MIYTTAWTREKIKTESTYQEWLKSLKVGDLVVLQTFRPASSGILKFPFDHWLFGVYKWGDREIHSAGDTKPIDSANAWKVYWNSDNPSGEVFPNRVVPLHRDLGVEVMGDRSIGHAPVYEPLWDSKSKCYYMIDKDITQLRRMPYTYRMDAEQGDLLIAFMDEPIEIPGCKFLYSQWMQY